MKYGPHKLQRVALIPALLSITLLVSPLIPAGVALLAMPEGGIARSQNGTQQVASAVNRGSLPMPLGFEANRGQAASDVKFVGRGPGFGILLKADQAIFALTKQVPAVGHSSESDLNDSSKSSLIAMKLKGANSTPFLCGVEPQSARANYFIGDDSSKWLRDVDTYECVAYSNVYRGIDLTFYRERTQLEYDFTLAPGVDPHEIRLGFEGATYAKLGANGDLILGTPAGELRNNRPVAYQESDGARTEIAASFKQLDDGSIGFEVGEYDHTRRLVIDPVLVYSTYVGGSASDFGRGIVADSTGNAYVVGDSNSSDFLFRSSLTNSDVFVGKLNPSGSFLSYFFFGGTKNDTATGLTVDSMGNVYVCGSTESSDFPRLGPLGGALKGTSDAFAIKLVPEPDQSSLIFEYSSLIGGSGDENSVSIAVDSAGSAYLTGRTTSTDFPTVSPIQAAFGGGASDAFVSKLAANGGSLIYSTYLGGSGDEDSAGKTGISVDSSGNAYIVGDTLSTNFPTKAPLQAAKNGSAATTDGFVAKINPTGSGFVYSTYLGGMNDDSALAVASDQTGNAYVAGRTKSASFTGSSTTRTANGTADAFVAKLNASGSAISYLTFIGGTGDDSANAIAIDSSGNATIAGNAGDGLTTVKSIQASFKGGADDALVATLNSSGSVTFSTYLGGSGDDVALGVGLDSNGLIYVTGFTDSLDFLTFLPLKGANAGARDIFIAKIDPNATPNHPVLTQALLIGKKLFLLGQNFDIGAVLRINDEPVVTRNDDSNPSQLLISKKGGKQIKPGKTVQLQIENPNGSRSNLLFFTKPL
jgi:hypothetical protein